MAVMTSLSPDGVEVELKTQPVPSSEKMALDLDINGDSKHDESARDAALPDPAMNLTPDLPAKLVASVGEVETNGAHNVVAVAANSALEDVVDMVDAPMDSEAAGPHDDASAALPTVQTNTNTPHSPTTTNAPTVPTPTPTPTPTLDPHTTSHVYAPSDDITLLAGELPLSITAVPPIVTAQESNLRDEILPDAEPEDFASDTQSQEPILLAEPDRDVVGLADATAEQIDSTALPSSVEDHPLPSVSNLDLNNSSPTESSVADTAILQSSQPDVNMMDAPPSPSKVAREREEDVEDAPLAKRTKMEVDDALAPPLIAAPPPPATPNGNFVAVPGDELPPTPYQQKELLKALKNIKLTQGGKNFVRAVADLWPTIKDTYLEKINSPMDLSIIERKLREGYPSLEDFKRDVSLIYENTLLYNGLDHTVTVAGATVRDYLIGKIPGPEPVKPEKKRKATTPAADPEPRPPPARRQSRGAPVNATSPTLASPTQTFALDPSGTPLIRRDSTKGEGGRPKREIHPPKSKDLIYSARPKKKKFVTELKFCEEVLNEIKKPKYQQYGSPFMVPVDPVALGIPDYFKIIKNPMDLTTVTTRMTSGQYENAKDFETDIKQIFKNCYKFNPVGSPVHEMGKAFEDIFDREWAKKAQWIADHATSNAASPSSDVDSDEEESEEEPEEVVSSTAAIQERLIEEQNKLIAIMTTKKPDAVLVRMQQDMIGIIQKQMDTENAKKVKTKPKPKPVKKSAAAGRKKAEPVKKAYRPKNIGIVEKEQISAGIVQLEGKLLDQAVAYLKMDYPNLNLDDETELDIDQFTNPVLSHLHDLIVKNVPGIVPAKAETSRPAKPSKPKKNKPMSKTEQETKIEKLKKLKEQFDRQGSTSDDAPAGRVVPSQAVEQDQSSGDESPSDSEED